MSLGQELKLPLILGHRGDSAHAPENTLAAFRLALENGANGFELDARLAGDGAVMVLHDARVDRVTGVPGELARLTQAQIGVLDAGSHFSTRFAGEPIPSLQAVFETFGAAPVYDLEIKNFDAPWNGLEYRVLELVRRYKLEKRVMITSFNPLAVRFFSRHLPQAPVGLLWVGGFAGRLQEALLWGSAWLGLVGCAVGDLPACRRTHAAGQACLVWGVQNPAQARSAVSDGAAVVVADDPAMVRRALENERG